MALGMVVFVIPNRLAPGGVSGLATAIHALIPIPIGMLSLLLNVPIFILALRAFGFKSLVRTGIAALLFSVFIDLLSPYIYTYTDNRFFASICGGVLLGAGLGLLFLRGVTSGGTDLISMLLKLRFAHISSGTLLLCIDALVILFAVLVFRDVEVALYSVVTIFVQGKLIDAIQQGVDYAKIVMIVTEKPEVILHELAVERGRGVTEFRAVHGYTGRKKSVLMSVAHRTEVMDTLQVAQRADPQAFIILYDATEVHGEGFKEL